MSESARKVFLFDIDYTLLYTGGAGSKAMGLAFEAVYGIADAFQGVPFAGWTDRAILKDGLIRHGLLDGDFEGHLKRFRDAYQKILSETLRDTQGRVLPGVPDLLLALHQRPDVLLGLATGNFQSGAALKLQYYGLDGHFLGGAFGDDYEQRSHLVAAAARHVQEVGGLTAPPVAVYVLGDTPHDVRAARVNGLTAVGVATGPYSSDELRDAGADLVFPDLGDWRAVLAQLLDEPAHQASTPR